METFIQKAIPTFTNAELQQFLALWKHRRTLQRGQWLNPKGHVEHYLYYVVDGTFRLCFETADEEVVVGFGYPDSFLNDAPSFLSGKPSQFYIEAIKSAELIGIHKDDLHAFAEANKTFAAFWLKMMEYALLAQIEREIDLLTTSPLERYNRLLKRSPHVFQHIPNKHIASYLRMTPETLSRLKKR
ncbi:MAG: Crp/Fnr family transcriptional regulator [Sphingobacteriales bacterium JAD_PAG50586_3]|nr:MAG: Crp/Fnr family transcriptional regulator [Sphingobacteriales bacterium JAD_PAG50586_3]